MKVQRNTFLLVLVATLGMGAFFVSEVILAPKPEQADVADGNLFAFEEAEIQAIQIQRPDLTLAFEKRDSPPEGESDWRMTKPETIQASDGAVAFLLNLLATGNVQQTLEVAGDRKAEFGFDQPAIVNVTLANGKEHVLVLGQANFDRSAFYALTDTPPNAPTLSVRLVSIDFEPAINRPLEEWKYTAELKLPDPPTPDPPNPELPTPESPTPESKSPESKSPESKSPESKSPEFQPES
ncbi:MAG: DUF4340 domain-containing protein [Synechococcales cyanobacterium CRU_2_2]|nr:DUF4340 domain-containing protein [Synechococcales cyanobacterium CRU_2_2]